VGSRQIRQQPEGESSQYNRVELARRKVLSHLESSKVDDIVNVWVLGEDLVESSFVCDVAFVKGRPLAADELDAIDDLLGGVVEIVDDDNLVVCLEECKRCERANVASATVRESVVCCCTMKLERKLRWGGGAALPCDENRSDNHCWACEFRELKSSQCARGIAGFCTWKCAQLGYCCRDIKSCGHKLEAQHYALATREGGYDSLLRLEDPSHTLS
jgi:hypothetical protein